LIRNKLWEFSLNFFNMLVPRIKVRGEEKNIKRGRMACRSQNWTSLVNMHHMLWETTVTVVNNTKERRKHTSKADTRVIQVRWLFSHVLKLKGWLVAVAERADNLSCIAIMTHLYQIAARAHHAIHPSFPFQQKKNPGVTCLKINYKLKK